MRTSLPFGSISVLMPVFQGAGLIERVLDALGAQSIEVPWDFLAVDSGSTDGTLELLERSAPPAFPSRSPCTASRTTNSTTAIPAICWLRSARASSWSS